MDPRDWKIVRSTPLFGSISQEMTQSIIGNHSVRTYEKDTQLFPAG